MEDIYYFSQGRLIYNVPYKKIEEITDVNDANNKGNNLFNFKIFNASILRYR